MKIVRIRIIAVTFLILSSCSATRLPDYFPLPIAQYTYSATQDALTVAIYPMSNIDEMELYFGYNLLDYNIFPIFIIANNTNKSSSFIIKKEKIDLLKYSDDISNNDVTNDTVFSEEMQMANTIGQALLSPILMFPTMGAVSDAAEAKRNLAMKEFQEATIEPGASKSGFVYFKLNQLYDSTMQMQVKAFNTKSKTSIIFNFKVAIEGN